MWISFPKNLGALLPRYFVCAIGEWRALRIRFGHRRTVRERQPRHSMAAAVGRWRSTRRASLANFRFYRHACGDNTVKSVNDLIYWAQTIKTS